MPAKSKKQARFFRLVDAYKKGELDNASPEVKKAADSMTKKEVRKFAKTKDKGLPERVKSSKDENVERYVDQITESVMRQIRSKLLK